MSDPSAPEVLQSMLVLGQNMGSMYVGLRRAGVPIDEAEDILLCWVESRLSKKPQQVIDEVIKKLAEEEPDK